MEDQPIGRLLRELPRERAGDDFTARVLARLDAAPPRRAAPPLRWALATAALLALVAAAAVLERQKTPPAAHVEARQVLDELRDEHSRLEHELRQLQVLQRGNDAGVVYLGGNEDLDLVVDLGRVREAEGATSASYREVF